MEINESDKTTILLNLLNERYNASHKMRERSMKFTIWILGFGVALIWILLRGEPLIIYHKIVLSLIVLVNTVVTVWFIYSIQKGFTSNKQVMVDIEDCLGCYQEGAYIESKSIFPPEYKKVKKTFWSHFKSIYVLVITFTCLILILIWINPRKVNKPAIENTSEKKVELQIDTCKSTKNRGN